MLDNLRNPNKERSYKKIVATIIFGLICFSFVFLGLTPGDTNFQGSGAVAYVNSSVISLSDFRERLEFNERQMGQSLTEAPAAQRQARVQELRQRTLNELVDQQVVVQEAEKAGILASDEAVRDQILNIAAFQTDGQFDRSRYDQYLSFIRATPGEFEKKVKSQVVDNQLRQAFFVTLKNPDSLSQLESELQETKLNIQFVQFTSEKVSAEKVTEFESALKENKANVDEFMKAHQLQWQETGLVDLANSTFMPRLGDHQSVVDAALASSKGELVPRVVRSGSQMFLVKLKDLQAPQSATARPAQGFSMAPFEALNSWSRAAREKAKVKINDAVL